MPHGEGDGVGEAVVGQDPLVVQDDSAGQGDPQGHIERVGEHLHMACQSGGTEKDLQLSLGTSGESSQKGFQWIICFNLRCENVSASAHSMLLRRTAPGQ